MRFARRPSVAFAIVLACGLATGAALLLVTSQGRARTDLEQALGARARLAARLVSSALQTSASSGLITATFSGSASAMPGALRRYEGADPERQAYVLDSAGRLLASLPEGRLGRGLVALRPEVRRALDGHVGMSGVLRPRARTPLLALAVPFASPHGRRVLVGVNPASVIGGFVEGFLADAAGVDGARAYVVDSADRLLAATTRTRTGSVVPERGLPALLARRASGRVGTAFAAAAPISGTPWRVVFVAPRRALYAPLDETHRTGWGLFLGFAAAIAGLVATGALAMRRTRQLATASAREQAASSLAHERLHDALTGLPNRALFLDRVAHALASRTAVAVVFLDLDRFNRINESLGHGSGDELLELVARRLTDVMRPKDTVSRFGGDEFVMCAEVRHADEALRLAAAAQAAVSDPIALGERRVRLTCSVGVTVHGVTDPAASGEALIREAHTALSRAKQRGRGGIELFHAGLHRVALEMLDTEVALRTAAVAGELRVHYQPIVDLQTGGVAAVEALARWQRPGHGLVGPEGFIGLAEETGLIAGIGAWVLERAMDDVAEWHRLGLVGPGFCLSVNLSPRQLAEGHGLVARVHRLLARWPLAPQSLCLEITESAVADDPESAAATLRDLAGCGVRLAIDDFGIGQSALEHLGGTLPVDVLKLDRRFVAGMACARERAIVSAVALLARDLDMTSVAEGVETAEQARAVAKLGYDRAQGYWFGRPANADTITGRFAVGVAQTSLS